jgi:hypothetical protein
VRSIITFRYGCLVNSIITFVTGLSAYLVFNNRATAVEQLGYCSGRWRFGYQATITFHSECEK